MNKATPGLIVAIIIVLILVLVGNRFFVTVPAGHVAVSTLFGKVQNEPLREGLHVPVNPLLKFTFFDARQKTLKDSAKVPSQDQLQTQIDVSIQYRLIGSMAPSILQDTGTATQTVDVHLVPTMRSLLREAGKSIQRAEDFFQKETQDQLQSMIESELRSQLEPKGIEIQAVLIRGINLPPFITRAIEAKKEREQEVEKQKAELERFRTEQEQVIASAEAARKAAEEQAAQRRVLADAQAYEIEKINSAIAENPAYLQLEALNALKEISKDPASKMYFMDGSSPNPLPLMNIGDPLK